MARTTWLTLVTLTLLAARAAYAGPAEDQIQMRDDVIADLVRKVLESAIANAESNFDVDVDSLYVVKATVDMGKSLRRIQPRAYGRADVVRHHTSHVTIVVGDRERG